MMKLAETHQHQLERHSDRTHTMTHQLPSRLRKPQMYLVDSHLADRILLSADCLLGHDRLRLTRSEVPASPLPISFSSLSFR